MKQFVETCIAYITFLITMFVMGLLTTFCVAWSSDSLFGTDFLDNYWILYLTITITIPLLRGQITTTFSKIWKNEKKGL